MNHEHRKIEQGLTQVITDAAIPLSEEAAKEAGVPVVHMLIVAFPLDENQRPMFHTMVSTFGQSPEQLAEVMHAVNIMAIHSAREEGVRHALQ